MTFHNRTLILCATFSSLIMSACTSEDARSDNSNKTPVVEAVTAPEIVELAFTPVENGRLSTGDVDLTFNGSASYILDGDALVVQFSDSQGMIQVFKNVQPRAGETYTLDLNVEQVGGDYNATVRTIFSRDCSGDGDDYGSTTTELDMDGGVVFMQTPHVFKGDYECVKMVLQVTNAYPDNKPITLRFDPSVSNVRG